MALKRLTVLLTAAAIAAAPATAFAGGAGDEQYQDPLMAPAAPKKANKKTATTAPAASTPTTSSPATAPAASSGSSGAQAATGELPRTGFPAGIVGLTGVATLAGGLALRRRTASS